MNVDMYLEGADQLRSRMKRWDGSMRRKMWGALQAIGSVWVTEAKKRVPVDTGFLRNSINKSVTVTKTSFELAVGSSAKYAGYTEFGTEHIAGGRVKALGTTPNITDANAIKMWPALAKRKGQRQQMPWLRPAWSAIKVKAMARMNAALEPPP